MASIDVLNSAIDDFDHQYAKLSNELINQVKVNVDQGQTFESALDSAIVQTGYNQKLVNLAYSGYQVGLVANSYDIIDDPLLKGWYEAFKSPYDKLTISKRIAKNNIKLKASLKESLAKADTWQETALGLRKTGDVSGKLPKYIKKVNSLYKKTNPTKTEIRQLKSALKAAQKNIDKLAANGAPNTALKKAYQNIINIASGKSKGDYEKGILRAIKNKAKYNAERISRTEIARANSAATKQRLLDDDDIIAVQYVLNSRHKIVDQCDYFAKANIYGIGNGKQPRSMGVRTPWHSNCFCGTRFIYRGDVGPLNKDKGIDWLNKNSSGTTQKERYILEQGKLPSRFNPHTYHDIDTPPKDSIQLQK